MIRAGLFVGILVCLLRCSHGQSLPTVWDEQERSQYPSPRDDFAACGRSNYSWVCDPNRQFTTEQVDELNAILDEIHMSQCPCGVRCPTASTTDNGFIVILAIVESYIYHGGEEPFERWFREEKQTDARCGEDAIVFYDFAIKRMTVSTGLRAFQTLTDDIIETIRAPFDSKLTSQNRDENFEGLKGFFGVANTVYRGTYTPPGLKVWAHMLIAAGASLAFIFLASMLFCTCTSCKTFWGEKPQPVLKEVQEEEDLGKSAGRVPFYHIMPSGVKGDDGDSLIDPDMSGESAITPAVPADDFAMMSKVGAGRKGRRV
ncbi:Hypp7384 [Branchiostoma lanceolatum]|uniref:Hypp7384 protein n=1 Tax=Branchiostoma lanceolatum TaxID=7740 RepID=A0A8J9YZS4_BRALA|nr:Hypp7384 [Branchiostoma lanceolatum]